MQPTEERTSGEPEGIEKVVTTLPVDHSGTTVYLKGWRRPTSTKSPIIIVHDLGEHTDLYRETAHELTKSDFSVYCFDLRGHGRSGRRLGHAPSFNVLVKDLLQVAAFIRHKEGGRAPIILGHGIGGLIVNEFTRQHGSYCKAAILSAPCLELAHNVSVGTRIALRLIADWLPTFRIPPRLSPKFARDLKHVQAEAEDGTKLPYFPRLTAIFTQELLSAIKRARAEFIEYHGMVLILCPALDTICSYAAIRKAAAIHDENNLQVATLEGLGHSIFTEANGARERGLLAILPWLEAVSRDKPRSEPRYDLRIKGASKEDIPLDLSSETLSTDAEP